MPAVALTGASVLSTSQHFGPTMDSHALLPSSGEIEIEAVSRDREAL
jgi:hypothetical protein